MPRLILNGYNITKDAAYVTWKTRRQGRRGRTFDDKGVDTVGITRWCEFHGKTLSQLIELRRKHLLSRDEQVRQWEESKMEEWLNWLSTLKVQKPGRALDKWLGEQS